MSPLIHYCVLCGHSIGHHGDMVSPSAWDYEYRIRKRAQKPLHPPPLSISSVFTEIE